MNLSGVIERFAVSLTIARAGGSYVQGRWVEAAGASLTARAVVQPSSGKDLERLPEGKRERGACTIYSAAELRLGDRFDHEGASWEVEHVEPWTTGAYWKGVATRRST